MGPRHYGNVLLACSLFAVICHASVLAEIHWVEYADIQPTGGPITFSEVRPGTEFPTYAIGKNTVHFGSTFIGQKIGAVPNTLADATPDGPLRLDPQGPRVATNIDLAQNSLALGGAAATSHGPSYFTTPIAILFDQVVQSVGFRVGALDSAHALVIQAYDRNGITLGQIDNPRAGVSAVGVQSQTGNIQGLSVFLPQGMDWEGFTIDDVIVTDGTSGEVPEPASIAIWMAIVVAGSVASVSWR